MLSVPNRTAPPPRSFFRRFQSLSEIIDPSRYEDPQWERLHRDLETYSMDKPSFRHWSGEIVRKTYEWTHCIFGLQMLGALQPDARALGVGAGHEPVIFWLADRIACVVATDLYGNEAWATSLGAEAAPDVFDQPERYCPRSFAREKIKFEYADGTKLPFGNETFDFCWSLSSIEHFGGHDAAAAAMREMARVTKPGGIVCVATEVLLRNDQSHPEYFTRREFNRYIVRASTELSLVGRMRWNVKLDDYIADPIRIPQDAHRLRRHVVLQDGDLQWTSAIAFFRKGPRQWADALRWLPPQSRGTSAPVEAAGATPAFSIHHHLVHNAARCEAVEENCLRVTTPAQPGSYAVELPPQIPSNDAGVAVEISAVVRDNPVRFGILGPDNRQFIQEVEAAESVEPRSLQLVVPPGVLFGSLMVRTAGNGSSTLKFEITRCELGAAAASARPHSA